MTIKTIDANTLKKWLDNKEALLVDVRESAENEAENISESVLVPLSRICKSSIPECSEKKLVIHCLRGSRGKSACEKILSEDPNVEIYNLEGGIESWKEAGLPVNKSKKFFLPLDRQVQITIGSVVLLTTILGYLLNPLFLIITGFFGAGLILAGTTGFCGLAIIMTKMPWNKGSKASCCMTKS
ncbi:MAG: rhodanese family protein [Rickettsiales bacterium]